MFGFQKIGRFVLGCAVLSWLGIYYSLAGPGAQTLQAASSDCVWQWREKLLPLSVANSSSYLTDWTSSGQEKWAAGYAVGKRAHPLLAQHTPDGWRTLRFPMRGQLHAIDSTAPNDVWAVGLRDQPEPYQSPVVLHYDGAQWQAIQDAAPTLTGELFDVRAISANDVWVVGTQVIPDENGFSGLTMHWNGSTWQVVPSPKQTWWHYMWRGLAVVNENDIWAVGMKTDFDSTLAAFMHWDGNVWHEELTPLSGSLLSVSMRASDDVWAVGFASAVFHWDGTQWNRVEFPFRADLHSVQARATDDVWVAGSTVKNGWSAGLVAHWDGAQWTREFVGNPKTALEKLTFVSPHRLVALGNGAQPFRVVGRCK